MIAIFLAFIVDLVFWPGSLRIVCDWIDAYLFCVYRDIHRGFSGDDPRDEFGRAMLRWLDARMSPRQVAIVITLLATFFIFLWCVGIWFAFRLTGSVYLGIVSWL
jgi:hypothetical protein